MLNIKHATRSRAPTIRIFVHLRSGRFGKEHAVLIIVIPHFTPSCQAQPGADKLLKNTFILGELS